MELLQFRVFRVQLAGLLYASGGEVYVSWALEPLESCTYSQAAGSNPDPCVCATSSFKFPLQHATEFYKSGPILQKSKPRSFNLKKYKILRDPMA